MIPSKRLLPNSMTCALDIISLLNVLSSMRLRKRSRFARYRDVARGLQTQESLIIHQPLEPALSESFIVTEPHDRLPLLP